MGKGWPEPSPLTHLGWGPGALTGTHLFCLPMRGLNQGFLFPGCGGAVSSGLNWLLPLLGGMGRNTQSTFCAKGGWGRKGSPGFGCGEEGWPGLRPLPVASLG